jgi:hypothetical protein
MRARLLLVVVCLVYCGRCVALHFNPKSLARSTADHVKTTRHFRRTVALIPVRAVRQIIYFDITRFIVRRALEYIGCHKMLVVLVLLII